MVHLISICYLDLKRKYRSGLSLAMEPHDFIVVKCYEHALCNFVNLYDNSRPFFKCNNIMRTFCQQVFHIKLGH